VPIAAALAPAGSPWSERMGRIADLRATAGGPWIHAASLGEAVAARHWVLALLEAAARPPVLVTTRTLAGRDRVARELGARARAAVAPLDFPGAIRAVLRDGAPSRLDLIETELWPNLLVEARRAGLPVVAVSATVSERTASRLRRFGLAGPELFGTLHVLAQSDRHAERFASLGVPPDRIRVTGDLKVEPIADAGEAPTSAAGRRLVVFASLRPGEADVAVSVARALRSRPPGEEWRYVIAPRHEEGARAAARALGAAGFAVTRRAETTAPATAVTWSDALGAASSGVVGLLETRGELATLFPRTRVAIVGGSFTRHGGHNVLEPAAAGAPVVVGPHHDEVEAGVARLLRRDAAVVADGAEGAAAAVTTWLEGDGASRASRAADAARDASGAARRALRELAAWGLVA
jgi:3-deoxy-D-manno-octulosonic-acid transferase